MKRLSLNIEKLLAKPFNSRWLIIFLAHWIAWLFLHFVVFLPTLVNMKNIMWITFLYNHVLLVTMNFLLFWTVGFFIMPLMANFQKKWFWVLLISMLLAIVFTFLKFRVEMYRNELALRLSQTINNKIVNREPLDFFSYRFRSYFQFNILTNVSIVVIAFAYRLLLIWFQQEKIRKELENQNLRTELSYLKMQINPHFLFNALNNIYSMAVIEGSTKTGNSILRLSDLMRYMLYEKEDANNRVSLEKEIRHINNYIELEKIRHLGKINIEFTIEGEVTGKNIPPLLLFPLIENAFKHGILTDERKPLIINMVITDTKFLFNISNFNNSYQKDKVGGIGLQNVRKRLDLLFGNSYTLDISHTAEEFNVKLELPL